METTAKKLNRIYWFFIIILTVLFILFLGIYIQKQNNQVVNDASVSGFGANATKDLFTPTVKAFLNTPCNKIFFDEYSRFSTFPYLQSAKLSITAQKLETQEDTPLRCYYTLSNGTELYFEVKSYSLNDPVTNSRSELVNSVNNNLSLSIDANRIGIIDYVYGVDSEESEHCRVNLFHPLNDFKYATIVYAGYDCKSIVGLNREITTIFGNYLVSTMEYVYTTFGRTNTAELLERWGYKVFVDDLKFYRF